MCSRLWNDRKCVECAFNLKLSGLSGGFVYLNLAGGDGDLDVRAPSCAVHQRRASIHYSLEKPTYFPTKFSSTELFPALCPPTTAICGRSRFAFCPMAEKASCMRFTRGIKSSIPRFPIFARGWWASFLDRTGTDIWLYLPLRPSSPPSERSEGVLVCAHSPAHFSLCFLIYGALLCVRSSQASTLSNTLLSKHRRGGGGGWALVFYQEIPAVLHTHR